MANNNRNSSSSSFSSSNRGSTNNNTFKSNSQSTFDMFNINVKDAQKKVTAIFDFTKGKIKDNEKASTKSINKIFNTLDSRIKNSAGLLESSFSRAYTNVNTVTMAHVDNYTRAMDKSINTIVANTQNKYKSMYQNLDRQHEAYTKKVQNRERSIKSGSNNGNNSSGSSTPNIRQQYNDSQSQKGFNFSIQGIADAMRQSVGNNLEKSLSKAEKYYDKKVKSGDLSVEEAQRLFNNYANNSNAARKAGIKSGAIEIGSIIVSGLADMAKQLLGMFTDGAKNFANQYESSYNQLATAFNSNRDGIHNMLDSGMSILDKDMKGVVNYSSDFLPALETVSKQGLMGDNALAKAITDSVDKKIMPWLDTASEQWVNMNTYLSQGNLNALKGQQLAMQSTQNGNRLLQSGVINSLTSDIEPLLRDIDFNTAGEMTGEAGQMMESLMNQGYTEREAYDYVKGLVDVQKNQYAALQSGDASKIIAATSFANGGDLMDANKELHDTVQSIAANAGSDVGVGAVQAGLGQFTVVGDTMTTGRANATYKGTGNESLNNTSLAGTTEDDWLKEYKKSQEEAEEKVTTTQEALNKIENTSAKTLGLWSTQIPLFWTFAGTVTSLLGKLANWGLDKLFNKFSGNGSGGGIKNLLSKGKNLLGKGKSLLPKLKGVFSNGSGSGISKVLGSTGAKVAGGVGGALMTIVDGVKGFKKSKEWFGENATTGDKVVSTVGGAIGGTGPGIGEKGATVGGVLKNIGSNTAKGALIGSVAGPIGTAIGAGVGAVTGAIGGKRIAKAFKKAGSDIKGAFTAWTDPTKSFGDKLKSTAKGIGTVTTTILGGPMGLIFKNTIGSSLMKYGKKALSSIGGAFKKIGKGIGGALKKGAKAIGGLMKKTSLGKTITGIADVWKDDTKSIGEKLAGSVGTIVKNNPLVKVAKKLGGALKKGAKAIFNAAKDSKIGQAAISVGKKIGKGASKAWNGIKKGAGKVWDTVTGWFASGSDEIQKDGTIAKLHKGETVFNAKATKAIKNILGITGKSVGESPLLSKLDSIRQKLSGSKVLKKIKNNTIFGKLFGAGISQIKDAAGLIKGSFASGTDNAPEGNSILHKGEMVTSSGDASVIRNALGITAKSVDSSSSILNKLKGENGIIKSNKNNSAFDDSDVIEAIGEATTKIVKAISENSSNGGSILSKLYGAIGKVKVSYDNSIVNMEPIDETN